jgi:hypothetical protein
MLASNDRASVCACGRGRGVAPCNRHRTVFPFPFSNQSATMLPLPRSLRFVRSNALVLIHSRATKTEPQYQPTRLLPPCNVSRACMCDVGESENVAQNRIFNLVRGRGMHRPASTPHQPPCTC